jgi:hypothetical protein
MLDLQPLIGLLHPAQFLELRRHFFIDRHTLGHDQTLAPVCANETA